MTAGILTLKMRRPQSRKVMTWAVVATPAQTTLDSLTTRSAVTKALRILAARSPAVTAMMIERESERRRSRQAQKLASIAADEANESSECANRQEAARQKLKDKKPQDKKLKD
jgi:hypothetical protein